MQALHFAFAQPTVRQFVGGETYMRGELGAVELTLCDNGGVSVRSFIILTAEAMAGIAIGADME